METLLLIVIILASVLGLVIILSISSLLIVQTKYSRLKEKHEREMEESNNKQIMSSSSYTSHPIYAIKAPKVEDVSQYQRLEELLLRDPSATCSMSEHFHPHSMDETAHSLVVLFEANEKASTLIKMFIDLEMAKANEAEGPTTLFRRDSVASKIMRFYSKLIGQQYLVSVLWPNIRLVALSDEFIELDRNRMSKEDDLDSHLVVFQEILANFLEAIVNSIPLCPPQLREICYHLNARANQHFPENNIKVLSGFIFLRFFTPAIIAPHTYGIVEGELTPNQSRTLLLVAKVLQNMANGIPFGAKEQYMMPLNDFLTANTPLVREFLTDLSSEEPKVPLRAFSVSTDSKFTAIRIIHTNIVRSFPKFKRDNYPELYDKVQVMLKELVDGEGKKKYLTKSMRRVSVALVHADYGSTSGADSFMPVQSLSLKAINVITPVVPATYSNQPATPPSDSELEQPDFDKFDKFEKFDKHYDRFDKLDESGGTDENEQIDQYENEENERNDNDGNDRNEEFESNVSKSASTIIATTPSSPSSPTSPSSLLSKGAKIPKSKSANINPGPKKKKNKNIPNERLYRPNSASKLTSTPSTSSSNSSISSSSNNVRSTSPMKGARGAYQSSSASNISTSPKNIKNNTSPKKARPAGPSAKLSPTIKPRNISNSQSSSFSYSPNNRDQFTQLPFSAPSPSPAPTFSLSPRNNNHYNNNTNSNLDHAWV